MCSIGEGKLIVYVLYAHNLVVQVPKGSWYCEPCQRRIDSRENAGDNDFTSIDMYRSSDLESALVDEALTARQRNMSEVYLYISLYINIYIE